MYNKYSNAFSEVLWYLNGIRQEDVNKIPKKLINFFQDNANESYKCNFDYYKPLSRIRVTKRNSRLNFNDYFKLLV